MNQLSRRSFLKLFGAASAVLLNTKFADAFIADAESKPFEMLVVGDSMISAQGLKLENKFYYLTKQWLQNEMFGGNRVVNLKVKAHSGARLTLHEDEARQLMDNGDDPTRAYHQEINLSFPSIENQISTAAQEYSDPSHVDLILLSGGITDVLVANVVNPFLKEYKLHGLINRYCHRGMAKLLADTAAAFPNARIAVVGYFPIISTKSDVNQISRYLFKTIKFPHPLQFAFTNPMSKQFMKVLRKKMAERSELWIRESNRALMTAISDVNSKLDWKRIYFVPTPITAETCFATKRSMLWETDDDNLPTDEMYSTRKVECPKAFAEIKTHHYGKLTNRMCELASIGHPNVDGSKAYFEEIKKVLFGAFAERGEMAVRAS